MVMSTKSPKQFILFILMSVQTLCMSSVKHNVQKMFWLLFYVIFKLSRFRTSEEYRPLLWYFLSSWIMTAPVPIYYIKNLFYLQYWKRFQQKRDLVPKTKASETVWVCNDITVYRITEYLGYFRRTVALKGRESSRRCEHCLACSSWRNSGDRVCLCVFHFPQTER